MENFSTIMEPLIHDVHTSRFTVTRYNIRIRLMGVWSILGQLMAVTPWTEEWTIAAKELIPEGIDPNSISVGSVGEAIARKTCASMV